MTTKSGQRFLMSGHRGGGLPCVVGIFCPLPFSAIMLQVLVQSPSRGLLSLCSWLQNSQGSDCPHMGPKGLKSRCREGCPGARWLWACCLLSCRSGQVWEGSKLDSNTHEEGACLGTWW